MQISENVQVSQKEFYDYLILSLLVDIHINSDKILLENELKKGFTYEKKLKSNEFAIVKIIELIKPKYYHVEIQVGSNTHILKYILEKIDENNTKVLYKEEYKSKKKMQEWNYVLISLLMKRKSQRKMKKMIHNMENNILNKCEKEEQ